MDCCSPRESGPLLSAMTCAVVSSRSALLWQIRDAFYPEILAVIPPDDGACERTAFVPSVAAMQGVHLFPDPWVPYYYGAEGIPDAGVLVNEWVFVRFDSYREFDRVVEELMGSGDSEVVVDLPAPPAVQNQWTGALGPRRDEVGRLPGFDDGVHLLGRLKHRYMADIVDERHGPLRSLSAYPLRRRNIDQPVFRSMDDERRLRNPVDQ